MPRKQSKPSPASQEASDAITETLSQEAGEAENTTPPAADTAADESTTPSRPVAYTGPYGMGIVRN